MRISDWSSDVCSSDLDRPISSETFEAACALDITQPLDFQRRLLAVHTFGAHAAAPNLAAANKRVRNILNQAGAVCGKVDPARFEHAADKQLFAALNSIDAQNATNDHSTNQKRER